MTAHTGGGDPQQLVGHWRARAEMEDHYDPEQTDEAHACMVERIRTYRRCADELEAALEAAAIPVPPAGLLKMCRCGHQLGDHGFNNDGVLECCSCDCRAFSVEPAAPHAAAAPKE